MSHFPPEAVAPAWHTGILLAYIAGISWLSTAGAAGPAHAGSTTISSTLPRPVIYATVIASEWILFGIAWWGIRLGRVSLGSMLGYRCCSDVSELPGDEQHNLLTGNEERVFDAYVNVGRAYKAIKQADKAREAFEYVIKTYPDTVAATIAQQNLSTPKP